MSATDLNFFTGLEKERFEILYSMLEKCAPLGDSLLWHKKDALLISLHKIRHNTDFRMMEFNFELGQKYLLLIFKEVIDKMYFVLKQIDIWGVSYQHPEAYRTILDCTKMFVGNDPSTSSSYNDHPTLKLLVGCDEMSEVNFISDAFAESISDRELIIKSGFLDIVNTGDAVLADKLFDVSDLLESKGVEINIPPHLKGKEHLAKFKMKKTRVTTNRKILIENINCRARKNKILITPMEKTLWPRANKIIYICFALVNFCTPNVNKR